MGLKRRNLCGDIKKAKAFIALPAILSDVEVETSLGRSITRA